MERLLLFIRNVRVNGKSKLFMCACVRLRMYVPMHFVVGTANDKITKCDQRVGSAVSHIYLEIKSNLNEKKNYFTTMAFKHFRV